MPRKRIKSCLTCGGTPTIQRALFGYSSHCEECLDGDTVVAWGRTRAEVIEQWHHILTELQEIGMTYEPEQRCSDIDDLIF